jgi:FkbM family methyltransferase
MGIKLRIKNALKTAVAYNLKKQLIRELVDKSKPGSVLTCHVNDMEMLLPIEILAMYRDCVRPRFGTLLAYQVERPHSDWICEKLKPGDVALDIGSSVGMIASAMSRAVGPGGAVYAFEPCRTTAGRLNQVISLNSLANIIHVPKAVSDRVGNCDFTELLFEEGQCAWVAEASSLAINAEATPSTRQLHYSVETTTIDAFVEETGIRPAAMKIDIEGFEVDALQGGRETFGKYHPRVCIDIHLDPRTAVSTKDAAKKFLDDLGYRTSMLNHVLLAEFGEQP